VPDLAVNPAEKIEIPTAKKKKPPFLKIDQCRQIFTCREIEIWDRVMLGCGMGAGLRIGELLAMEAQDVHLDDEDPHLYVQYGGDGHAPTKGTGEPRRVELCEPGLGFWRLWMRDYYAGGVRVFDGPSGGYMWHWAANFPRWAKFAGRERMTSHIMRHTYAVAMLSGSWGYDPKPMLLVSGQLGHASVQVTEDHYAAIEGGTAAREFRIATGRKAKKREPVTALSLLGHDVSPDVSHFSIEPKKAVGCDFVVDGRHLPLAQIAAENGSGLSDSDASTRQQDLTALARAVLDAVEARDGTGETRGVELAMALLAAGGVAIPGRAVG
jgi:site-specific recombinase XerC